MLNTLTSATFNYNGYVDERDDSFIANRSLNKFEEQFKQFVDKVEDRPAYERTE